MDHAAVAKKIRETIFDRAEQDGRVMHADAMDEVIRKVLENEVPAPRPYGYAMMAQDAKTEEWR